MRIVRLWVFEKYLERLKYPECKPSETNRPIITRIVGEYQYWRIDGDWRERVTKLEAERWSKIGGEPIELLRDIPQQVVEV